MLENNDPVSICNILLSREVLQLLDLQIKDMSDKDLAKYWSNYVKEIAVLLVSVEGDPQPPAEVVGRIQELVQKELLFLYIRLAALWTDFNSCRIRNPSPYSPLWRGLPILYPTLLSWVPYTAGCYISRQALFQDIIHLSRWT